MKKLKATGIKFVLHVVGFGVDAAAESQLRCLAEATGGRYFGAHDARSLRAALGSVQQEVAEKVEAARSRPAPGSPRSWSECRPAPRKPSPGYVS